MSISLCKTPEGVDLQINFSYIFPEQPTCVLGLYDFIPLHQSQPTNMLHKIYQLLSIFLDETLVCVTLQMKATEQYFHVSLTAFGQKCF